VGRGVRPQGFVQFLRALVTEIGAAEHEQRRDDPGRHEAEHQGRRQKEQEFVLDGAQRDPADDGQLSVRGEANHIARRHRSVIDDNTGGLGARPRGLRGGIVQGRSGNLRQGDDVVEKGKQSGAQGGGSCEAACEGTEPEARHLHSTS
jgi:hypothetical protein